MSEVDKIHTELRRKLAETFGTFDKPRFKSLLNSLRFNLTLRERIEAKDMYDILDALENNGTISPGKYNHLIEIMDCFDNDIKSILEKAEIDIQIILSDGKYPWVSKYERKSKQPGLVLFVNEIQDTTTGNEDIQKLKNFFVKTLLFECETLSSEDSYEPSYELNRKFDSCYCVVCFVNSNDEQGNTVKKVTETINRCIDKPKVLIVISTNPNLHMLNSHLQYPDLLIAYAPTYELLTETLTSCYRKHHIEEMLVCIRNGIAEQKTENAQESHCKMPFSLSTLTKLFYLEAA